MWDITPKPSRPDDPIYNVPALGSHYSQVWGSELNTGMHSSFVAIIFFAGFFGDLIPYERIGMWKKSSNDDW